MEKAIVGTFALLIAMAAVIVSCTTTQTPGEQVDDGWIATKVKAKLTGEHFSNLVNVEVNVTNGVVTLAGTAPSQKVRAEAEAAAWNVEGVASVNNNIQVEEPSASVEATLPHWVVSVPPSPHPRRLEI